MNNDILDTRARTEKRQELLDNKNKVFYEWRDQMKQKKIELELRQAGNIERDNFQKESKAMVI